LAPDDQLLLIECLGDTLPATVQRATALRDIMAMLAEEKVEEALLQTLGTKGLRGLIETPEQFAEVLQWVYGQCDALALDLLGAEFLRDLLETGQEISLALTALETSSQQKLLEALGWNHVTEALHDERDVRYLLQTLPCELSRKLLEAIPPTRLRQLVKGERDWRAVEPFLEASEQELLRSRLEASDAQ
ncbi:MAG: hypothetical protein WCP21_14485, partial [Armatimonadota bacterium]